MSSPDDDHTDQFTVSLPPVAVDRTDRAALDAAAGVLAEGGADERYQGVLADFARHGWGESELCAAARALVRVARERGEVTS